METETPATTDLASLSLYQIACIIRKDWARVHYSAVPYLQALASGLGIRDHYGMDPMRSVVVYFLGNASTWKGATARAVKAELKKRLK
jgi:hypothetical protein